MLRTDQQNRALHLWFKELSNAMNEAGFEQKITVGATVDVPWSPETTKILFKKIGLAQFDKVKTSEMTTGELTKTADTMNRFLSEYGIHVPFPSEQELQSKIKGYTTRKDL